MRAEARGIWTRRVIAEGIGTFFLVLIGPGAAMVAAMFASQGSVLMANPITTTHLAQARTPGNAPKVGQE